MLLRVLLPNGRVKLYSSTWSREEAPLGWRVLVPTRNGGTTGVVIGLQEGSSKESVVSFPDEAPLIDSRRLELVEELSIDYLYPKGVLLFKLLPSAFLWEEVELIVPTVREQIGIDRKSMEVLDYLKRRRGVKLETLKKRYSPELIKLLLKKGFISIKREWKEPSLEPDLYRLKVPLREALKGVRSDRKRRLLTFMSGKEWVSSEDLEVWGFKKRDLRELVSKGVVEVVDNIPSKDTSSGGEFPPVKERADKSEVLWADFRKALERTISVCKNNLSEGHSTLVLFPDKSEMFKAIESFRATFGDKLVEIFSGVSAKKVYKGWFRAREKASVVVGTYIASLCPAKELACVVLFDESSQGVRLKHVHNVDLRRLSYRLAQKLGCELMYTTPAPSLSAYYLALKRGNLKKLWKPPEIMVAVRKPSELLTEEAYRLIRNSNEGSTLVLVPKQGYSYLYCPRCTTLVECPECGTFLTYSLKKGKVYCTSCYYTLKEPTCPECYGDLEELGIGIEKAMEIVEENVGYRENIHFATYPAWESEYEYVIVLSADSILSVPSYRSKEELMLYILRAMNIARSVFMVQTTLPEERIFSYISKEELDSFYREELRDRERELLPPFWRLVLIRSKNRNVAGYIHRVVSPNIKTTYNVREETYDILVKFKHRGALRRISALRSRFGKDIIEVRVDPF